MLIKYDNFLEKRRKIVLGIGLERVFIRRTEFIPANYKTCQLVRWLTLRTIVLYRKDATVCNFCDSQTASRDRKYGRDKGTIKREKRQRREQKRSGVEEKSRKNWKYASLLIGLCTDSIDLYKGRKNQDRVCSYRSNSQTLKFDLSH